MTRQALITVSPIYRQAVEKLIPQLEAAGLTVTYLNRADEQLPAAELIQLLQGVSIYIVSNAKVTREVLEAAPDLRLVCKFGVGVDNIDLGAAAARGVTVTNAPGANAISVAEMTIGLLLTLTRRLPLMDRTVREHEWRTTPGQEVYRATMGIIGLGNIGKQVARRARAFDMRVLSNDIVDYPDFCREHGVEAVSLDTVLAESDVVTLHVPLTPLTRYLIGEPQLRRMKRGAVLIHTARGGVVEEAALDRALRSGHLAGAAIDVFEREPLGASPLREHDNVILTPHVAGITQQAAERMAGRTAENVRAFLAGEAPPHVLRTAVA